MTEARTDTPGTYTTDDCKDSEDGKQTVCTLCIKQAAWDRAADVIYSYNLVRRHQRIRVIWAENINRWKHALDIWLTVSLLQIALSVCVCVFTRS